MRDSVNQPPRFMSRNNGKNTNAAGISASPHMMGTFGGVDGGAACECASRVAAIHGADAQERVDQ
jgi:hypothetical protein